MLFAALAAGLAGAAYPVHAQGPSSAPRGTNYDPPVVRPRKEVPPPPPPPPEPLIPLNRIDFEKPETWVKTALLMGSIGLALRAFRQMKGE